MFNKKELLTIGIIVVIITFSISLMETLENFLYTLLTVFLVISINISAKKVASFYLESEIEIKFWEINRYGIKPHQKFKKPFPAGAFLPIISKLILAPFKSFVWMASLIFEVKPKVYRAAKRHGFYSFSEMTENHIGLIAAAGIFANILFSMISYLIGFQELAKINIYYSFFNMIPLSNLDGNKIFFGNKVLWCCLGIIVLIALFYSIMII